MMRSYQIQGSVQQDGTEPATSEIAIVGHRRLLPGVGREAGAGEITAAGDEVVRVELENGFVLWTRADDLIRERGRKVAGRDGSEGWTIDTRPPAGKAGTRGWLGLGIKVLDFFGIDLQGKAASFLGGKAETAQLKGNDPGFYRCPLDDGFKLAPLGEDELVLAGPEPILVFIHGTASSTQGSFGELWVEQKGADARRKLKACYGDRVYALEHRSLTVSPIRNALDLLKHLPVNAEVHLVSHSRGGLVGELLCLGERDKTDDPLKTDLLQTLFAADRTIAEQVGLSPLNPDAAAARDKSYDDERGQLKALLDLLDERKIKVRRFVRVACPARGTTLASGRLDRWLSVLDHFTGSGLVNDAADFLLAVVKERTDPRTLPGLEAMMPGSALTRLLQTPGLVTAADLSVISGDIEGDSLWGRIKLLMVDWFYGADHDLVVNTGSMYGGIRRPDNGSRFQFDQGPDVCHFNYFKNEKSVDWLVNGLTRADDSDGGYRPMAAAREEAPKWREAVRRSRATATPRPLAVVLPGTMGSALKVQGDGVWLNYWALMRGGLGRLRMGTADIEPTDVLDDFYGPLLEFLARSHRVEIFPYDWRLSIRDAAAKLADHLESWLPDIERQGLPVHLVAHSMGGLVVRAMIADGGRGAALWRRITSLPNSRFMMLGTPNLGSYEAVRWLTGENPTEAKLSLLDLAHSKDQIIGIVNDFPGLLELLPFDPDSEDFSQPSLWTGLKQALMAHWATADAAGLGQARDSWNLLKQAAPDPKYMVYVAGCQDATVAGYRLADFDEDWLAGRKRLAFDATARGDGTVTWKSGFLPGVPVWYVADTAHDELCKHKDALPGYFDLLMTGTTTRLPAAPPAGARAAAAGPELFPMPVTPPTDDLPDEESVRSLGFGPSRPWLQDDRPVVPVIRLSLCHGDLAYARHPVMVGHYQGDTIINAERQLDDRLGQALSRRVQLGLYPGQARTHAVFINEKADAYPGGALIVGLGQVGELSTTLLQGGVRDTLLDYALQVAQWPDERFGKGGVRSAAVSCLLIGTGPGGVPVRDSIEAVLRAAVAANLKLEQSALNGRVLIDAIEFVEIYEDVAITAAEALAEILGDDQWATKVEWPKKVVEPGQGRRRRVRCDDSPGWWHRLEIVEEKGDGLRFIASTDRARAEVTQSTGQLRLTDSFIRQASQSPGRNEEAAKTLFEMLLPNQLKELAPKQTDLVLLVDEVSAVYPWELLEDRWSLTGMPPAVASGLVRQMKETQFRHRPAHASAATAYVVGNPNLEGWSMFPSLPGAREEAQKVAALLAGGGYRVTSCIDEKYPLIVDGLHKDAWRILHLAGHGEHLMPLADEHADDPERKACDDERRRTGDRRPACASGMIIGKNTFLTPGDVAQMRWVPELVFINCCHLGKTQGAAHGEYNRLAANLGAEFVRMGVKAVVAAGWAVDDAAAATFAETFYRHMLAGDAFGDAVRSAREEIWSRYPDVNTWGAYQCYGDPGFRLHTDGSAPPKPAAKPYYAPAELVADLGNLTESIRMQMKEAGSDAQKLAEMRDDIGRRLVGVPDTVRAEWLARGDVAAALGFAWGETGAWAEAVDWLEKAIRAERGDCPVRAVEQGAYFRARLAMQNWRESCASGQATEATRQDRIAEIESALGELDSVARRAPTQDRLDLLGTVCKRLAWLRTEPGPRLEALINMANYYRKSFDLGQRQEPYPFNSWAFAKLLALRLDPGLAGAWQDGLEAGCRRMVEQARQRDAVRPSFWNGVVEADSEVILMLARNDMASAGAAVPRIVELYRNAARRGASPKEYASVLENLDFVIELLGADPLAGTLASIRAAL